MTKRKFIKYLFISNIFLLFSSILFFFYKILSNISPAKFVIYSINLKDLNKEVNEFEKKKIAIIKSHNKLYAISTICTHLGCTVRWDNKLKIFQCPCHQSAFSKLGKVLRGPAKTDLKQVKYIIKGDKIVIWSKNS